MEPGTREERATPWVFEQTRLRNAAGNNSRLCSHAAIITAAATRPTAARNITNRLPPLLRSAAGPMSGATTANGRRVHRRPRAVLPRAAVSGTLTNTDPARATTTRASPAEDRRLTTARRPKRVERHSSPTSPSRNG